MEKAKTIPANRLPLAQTLKKLKESLVARVSTEHSEDKHEVENHSTLDGGNEIGNVRTRDGKVVEQQASVDMQNTGEDEKALKRAGDKDAKVVRTVPTRAGEQAHEEHEERSKSKGGDSPKETQDSEEVDMFGAGESKQTGGDKTKQGKADKSLFQAAKGGKGGGTEGEEGSFKAKTEKRIKADDSQSADKSKSGGSKTSKPDKSMSKMASQTSADTQGAPDLTKSQPAKGPGRIGLKVHGLVRALKKAQKDPAKPASSNPMPETPPLSSTSAYKIEAKPGEITYSKDSPEAPVQAKPKWKQDWEAKSQQYKSKFAAKLSEDRKMKARIKQKPGQVKKSLEDKYMIGRQVENMDKGLDGSQPGWKNLFSTLRKNASAGYPEMGIAGGTPEAQMAEKQMNKAAPGAPTVKAPSLPKAAIPKMSKMDEKKQKLIQMARMGQERPLTSTPLGHALANYTDPNSFSYDARFAATIMRLSPSWAEK